MPEGGGKGLVVRALASSATVSDLAIRHDASHKIAYPQADQAHRALDDTFIAAATDHTVLFEISGRQAMVAPGDRRTVAAVRSSYLGIIEFMRDVLGRRISIGTIHSVLHAAVGLAGVSNGAQGLSCIQSRVCRDMGRTCHQKSHYLLAMPRSSMPD
jgi:hypothetical protein